MPPTRRLAERRATTRTSPAAGTVAPVELLTFDADGADAGITIPTPEGVTVQRVTSSLAFEAALRTFRRGVVAVTMPPASAADLERLATSRRGRDGIRALLVNAADDATGRLEALTQGFDDAVPDSVGADELTGRLLVLFWRARDGAADRVPVAPGLELDRTARALRRHGRLIHLRPMEFRLLDELARNPGRPMSRQILLRQVWGTDTLDGSRTVDVHVRWLRSKVERDPERPEHLITVRGVGYQLEPGLPLAPDDGVTTAPLTSR